MKASALGGRWVGTADYLFDGEVVHRDWAVVIDGDKIAEVLPAEKVDPSLPRVSRPGCTLLPGLIDTHMHFMRWEGPGFLAYGVTTVRDTGNVLDWILARRAEWTQHLWPRILCQGPMLEGTVAYHPLIGRACADEAAACTAVRETAAAGVDSIKFYASLNADWLPAMVAESRAQGRKTSMHCLAGGVLKAGRAGVDEFFHQDGILADIWPDHPPGWLSAWGEPGFEKTLDRQREVVDEIRRLGMTATPTLAFWDSQWRVRQRPLDFPDTRYVSPSIVQWQSSPPDDKGRDLWRRGLERAQRFTGLLLERGVPVLAGTDVPCGGLQPGLSLWRELTLFVESGMTPLQALKASTSAAAKFLDRPELGRLAVGAVADMVFVRGNPTERIPDAPAITDVVRQGRVHSVKDLLAAAAQEATRVPDDPWGPQFEAHWKSSLKPAKSE